MSDWDGAKIKMVHGNTITVKKKTNWKSFMYPLVVAVIFQVLTRLFMDATPVEGLMIFWIVFIAMKVAQQ